MYAKQLEHLVIRPVLKDMGEFNPKLNTDASVILLLGTAAQESHLGYYLHQISGPAKGLYQIESPTHDDLINRYLQRLENKELRNIVLGYASKNTKIGDDSDLIWNLRYATAICRIRYWMEIPPLPAADDLPGIAKYWDDHYNANDEHGTVKEFLDNYAKYVGDFAK